MMSKAHLVERGLRERIAGSGGFNAVDPHSPPDTDARGEDVPITVDRRGDRTVSAHQRRLRVGIGVFWLLVVVVWIWRLHVTGTSPTASLQTLIDELKGEWWAIPVFIGIYTIRPLVLFPASLLTIAAGILFGPFVGVVVAAGGANLSALVAFQIGKTFSPASFGVADPGAGGLVACWSGRMRRRSFVTVMVMRLAFLPYDLVNYVSGFLGINVVAFLAATALGSLPGTISFVLAGASLHRVDRGLAGFDPRVFGASVLLFAVSLVVAKLVQRREPPLQPGAGS